MTTIRDISKLFINNEFIGCVLRYTTLLEFDLDCLLLHYFIREDRINIGLDLLISELNFSRKIELLASLPIRKKLISYRDAISGLRRFRKIRNIVAHSWIISRKELTKLLQVDEFKVMLFDYPDGMEKFFRKTSNGINRLHRTKEFINPISKSKVDPVTLGLEKIFESL